MGKKKENKMIRSIIFIAVISTLAIVALTYLVAPKPQNTQIKKEINLYTKYMPNEYKLIGSDKIYTKVEIIKNDSFIIVGNHEALAVINDINKLIDTKNKSIILVANISTIPWALKELAIEPTLEKFMENRNIKMIFDTRGDVVYSLGLNDQNPLNYNLFKIYSDGTIKKLYTGKVKSGALDGNMSEEEKREALRPILSFIK